MMFRPFVGVPVGDLEGSAFRDGAVCVLAVASLFIDFVALDVKQSEAASPDSFLGADTKPDVGAALVYQLVVGHVDNAFELGSDCVVVDGQTGLW